MGSCLAVYIDLIFGLDVIGLCVFVVVFFNLKILTLFFFTNTYLGVWVGNIYTSVLF